MDLTLEKLNEELKTWVNENGPSRDKDDQRFGQHLWNTYDLDKLFPERDSAIDGFGDEKPSDAYSKIMNAILKTV
jgi:hypothetical protein|tara:strand:- start:397 stop:621 length:225 start_codon:yes stop_codon:yes gene_type:complete